MQHEFDVLLGDENFQNWAEDKSCDRPEETTLLCLQRHTDADAVSNQYSDLLVENRRIVNKINAVERAVAGPRETYFRDTATELVPRSNNILAKSVLSRSAPRLLDRVSTPRLLDRVSNDPARSDRHNGNLVTAASSQRSTSALQPVSTNMAVTNGSHVASSAMPGQKRKAADMTATESGLPRPRLLSTFVPIKTAKRHDKPWIGLAPLRRPEATDKWYSRWTTEEEWAKASNAEKRKLTHIGHIHETDAGQKNSRECGKCGISSFSWEREQPGFSHQRPKECWSYKEDAVGVYTLAPTNNWRACARCKISGDTTCCQVRNADKRNRRYLQYLPDDA